MTSALITGATSGIGLEYARSLATEGFDLVLVARDKQRLRQVAAELTSAGVTVELLAADLAEPKDLARVCSRLEQTDSPVGILVNNAGFGIGQPFLDTSFDVELYALDVMVRAVLATSYYAGRAMRRRGKGAIINVSSVAADTGMGPYSAHKAWVRAFSEGLAYELKDTGVTVTAVMPGLVRTDFHRRAGANFGATPDLVWLSPQRVVQDSLAAARRGQVLVTPSTRYKITATAARLAPRPLVRLITSRLPHM